MDATLISQVVDNDRSGQMRGKWQQFGVKLGLVSVGLVTGVLVSILECDGPWCRLETHGFRGWLPRKGLRGVKDGERIK